MTNTEFKLLKIRIKKAAKRLDRLQKIHKKETGKRLVV